MAILINQQKMLKFFLLNNFKNLLDNLYWQHDILFQSITN